MFDNYEDWVESVDDTVFAYFGEPLMDFVDRFGLNLDDYYYYESTPDDIVSEIQKLIEEEEYPSDD